MKILCMLPLAMVLNFAGFSLAEEGGNKGAQDQSIRPPYSPDSGSIGKSPTPTGKSGPELSSDVKAKRAMRKQARDDRHAAMAKAREQAISDMLAERRARKDAEASRSSSSIEENRQKADKEKAKEKGNGDKAKGK